MLVRRGILSLVNNPLWSQRGDWIASTSFASDRETLFVLHSDGYGLRKLHTTADVEWLAGVVADASKATPLPP